MRAKAEKESMKTCEDCGKPGCAREGGWTLTLCDDCANGNKPLREDD